MAILIVAVFVLFGTLVIGGAMVSMAKNSTTYQANEYYKKQNRK